MTESLFSLRPYLARGHFVFLGFGIWWGRGFTGRFGFDWGMV